MKLFRKLSIAIKALIAPAILTLGLGIVALLAIWGLSAHQATLSTATIITAIIAVSISFILIGALTAALISTRIDISERKQGEAELARRNAARVRANEEMGAFTHTVAHDLKNPLAVIIGYAEVLEQYHDTLTEDLRAEYLHIIAQQGRRMSNIIRELLLLASVRQGQVQVVPLDMGRIVAGAQKALGDMIEEYQGTVVSPDTWPLALGYGPWIEEVWIDYISNALKYGGRPPRVELGAMVQPDGMVHFWVRDNGPGPTPRDQSHLFQPLARLDKVPVEGHGLGLSIVRHIVEKIGGQVGVEPGSEPDGGSIFFFTLPGVEN